MQRTYAREIEKSEKKLGSLSQEIRELTYCINLKDFFEKHQKMAPLISSTTFQTPSCPNKDDSPAFTLYCRDRFVEEKASLEKDFERILKERKEFLKTKELEKLAKLSLKLVNIENIFDANVRQNNLSSFSSSEKIAKLEAIYEESRAAFVWSTNWWDIEQVLDIPEKFFKEHPDMVPIKKEFEGLKKGKDWAYNRISAKYQLTKEELKPKPSYFGGGFFGNMPSSSALTGWAEFFIGRKYDITDFRTQAKGNRKLLDFIDCLEAAQKQNAPHLIFGLNAPPNSHKELNKAYKNPKTGIAKIIHPNKNLDYEGIATTLFQICGEAKDFIEKSRRWKV